MSNGVVSRRAVLPTLVGGAAAIAFAEHAEAKPTRLIPFQATAGPASIVPGQTLVSSLFLPAVQANALPAVQFQLQLFTLDGQLLGNDPYSVKPGQGVSTKLQAFGDGSVRLNGNLLNIQLAPGEQLSIIAVLIGLLLPAVQTPAITLQCSNNNPSETGAAVGLGAVTYLLPYIHVVSPFFADGSV